VRVCTLDKIMCLFVYIVVFVDAFSRLIGDIDSHAHIGSSGQGSPHRVTRVSPRMCTMERTTEQRIVSILLQPSYWGSEID
jgi:hypothetical protein